MKLRLGEVDLDIVARLNIPLGPAAQGHGVVRVDEKSQIQALDRTHRQPAGADHWKRDLSPVTISDSVASATPSV